MNKLILKMNIIWDIRMSFQRLREVMAKANEEKSGDRAGAGVSQAETAEERGSKSSSSQITLKSHHPLSHMRRM